MNRKLLGSQHDIRICVLSDLHLELQDWTPPKADADVVVLAGDIHVGVKGIEWARRSFPSIPIVYVAGNHEFYGEHIHDITQELLDPLDEMSLHCEIRRRVQGGHRPPLESCGVYQRGPK